MTYGDYEPEDAWDRSDTIREQIVNLFRRLALLDNGSTVAPPNVELALDVITDRLRRARAGDLDGRARLRAEQLRDDLAFVRSRLP